MSRHATGTAITETLIKAANQLGFHVHHETDSRRTNPGFPDLIIVGYGTQIVIECKSQYENLAPPTTNKKGKPLPGQLEWLLAFREYCEHVYICRDVADVKRDSGFAISLTDALNLLSTIREEAILTNN